MEGWKQILNAPEEISALFEARFKLSDLSITARVLMHWKEKGLLPNKNDASSLHEIEIPDESKIDKWTPSICSEPRNLLTTPMHEVNVVNAIIPPVA